MAATATAPTDKDLASVQEARRLAQRARQAAPALAEFSQAQIDKIIDAAAGAATPRAEEFARLAVEETTYGVVADKVEKNLFSSEQVYRFIRPMKTVGVVNRIEDRKIVEIAEPFGVVAAIVPSTNPTSTAIYKVLIALKARCPIVISPHPSAARCITRTVEIMAEAAQRAGAPAGSIGWMKAVTLEGTQELMKQREVAVMADRLDPCDRFVRMAELLDLQERRVRDDVRTRQQEPRADDNRRPCASRRCARLPRSVEVWVL